MTKTKIVIELGKLSEVGDGAVVVPITGNPYDLCFRGSVFISATVIDAAGRVFHNRAFAAGAPEDGEVLIVDGKGFAPKNRFQLVLFVVNAGNPSFSGIINKVLETASGNGVAKIIIPIEMVVGPLTLAGISEVEKSGLKEMARAVNNFRQDFPDTSIKQIVFMGLDQVQALNYLSEVLENQASE